MTMLPFHDPINDADGASKAHYVRVVVERAIDKPEGLTYRTETPVEPGAIVRVPIGRNAKPCEGVVIASGGEELLDGYDPFRVKDVTERLDVVIPKLQRELCSWISTYYACPNGMVYAGAVPRAVRQRTGLKSLMLIERAAEIPDPLPKLSPSATHCLDLIKQLDASAFPIERKKIKDILGIRSIAPINALIASGILQEYETTRVETPSIFQILDDVAPRPETLTTEQSRTFEGISDTMGAFGVHLVHGVTGSGKTELYMRLIERVLERGETALVLVPEIALTPQTAGRFVSRFKDTGVALLHSGLNASSRHAQWNAAQSGQARVVVGARSAIFAPIENIGLIVVDEEHDSSYKQDRAPRYNARDAAIVHAKNAGCPIVLGSATPSLESWHNVALKRSTLWTLRTRATGSSLPKVTVVDMTRERTTKVNNDPKPRAFPIIGATLENAINETLDRGEQVLAMLNKRGYASLVASADPNCDWVLRCEQCDCAMVVHKSAVRTRRGSRFVRCHHCESEQLIPTVCPVSGKGVTQIGAGTQRVEDELVARFGSTHDLALGSSLERVDSDSMRSPKDYFDVLDRFSRGEIRVLLGTQMISKGLDFPNVTLVAVLSADTSLMIPDFRAEERTFQLVAQVAGRAGRGEKPGRVIVQTINPGSPAITLAASHDSTGFARRELSMRHTAQLPPSTRLARIVCRDEHAERAREQAQRLTDLVLEHADQSLNVRGPTECVMARIANIARWELELSAPGPAQITRVLSKLRELGELKPDASTAVDVDPLWLL